MKPKASRKRNELLIESARQRVVEVLFRYPEKEFSLSDLAKEAGVAKQHIGGILDDLARRDLVHIEKLSKIWRIRANQANWLYQRSKIVYNLNFVYQSGLVEFLAEKFQHPRAIVLFGSFRDGQDTSASDIAIETDETEEHRIIGLKELVPFETSIHRNIQLHLFNRQSVDPNVFASIANGIVLLGFLEVKP